MGRYGGKKLLEKNISLIWGSNIKIDSKEIGCEGVH
jgi:hypothetical protein